MQHEFDMLKVKNKEMKERVKKLQVIYSCLNSNPPEPKKKVAALEPDLELTGEYLELANELK